jgi:hypothetical protein
MKNLLDRKIPVLQPVTLEDGSVLVRFKLENGYLKGIIEIDKRFYPSIFRYDDIIPGELGAPK